MDRLCGWVYQEGADNATGHTALALVTKLVADGAQYQDVVPVRGVTRPK